MPYEIDSEITKVQSLLQKATADSAWPGAVLLAAKDGKIFFYDAVGYDTNKKKELCVNRIFLTWHP